MKSQFVSYEIAAAMEELGFKDECLGYYDRESGELFFNDLDRGVIVPPEILLPVSLWQQVEEWFREKHHLFINVLGDGLNGTLKGFYYSITEDGWINWYESVDDSKWYDTYEEAREQAVLEAIKIAKGENE